MRKLERSRQKRADKSARVSKGVCRHVGLTSVDVVMILLRLLDAVVPCDLSFCGCPTMSHMCPCVLTQGTLDPTRVPPSVRRPRQVYGGGYGYPSRVASRSGGLILRTYARASAEGPTDTLRLRTYT